jgi:RNA polymerase sigma factor (sigma-70 family)
LLDTNDIGRLRDDGARWLRKQHPTLTKDEHEDVLQDALIELVRARESAALNHHCISNPGALLGTIIDRRAANLIRAKKRRARVEVPGGSATDLSVLSDNRHMSIDGAIFAADFDRALRTLPQEQRDAFILYELRGLTAYEAGLTLGVLPSTLSARVDQAKELLREAL